MKNLRYMLFIALVCFAFLSNANANATCVYEVSYATSQEANSTTVTCNISNNGVSCSSNNLSVASSGVSLTPNDFKTGNVLKCNPKSIYILVDSVNRQITNISTTKGTHYDTLKLNINASKEESSSTNPTNPTTPIEPSEPPKTDSYENDSRYISAKEDYEKYCNDSRYKNYAKCEEATNRMQRIRDEYKSDNNYDGFCKGAVQGVFTALGWVFFSLKILIPIILIIFGIIDFSKAIIASKDDEIKKAAKSVAIRAIAGVVIFFVPSLLGIVVGMIDDSNVYKGTFWDCTKCMLNPGGEACSGLGGN